MPPASSKKRSSTIVSLRRQAAERGVAGAQVVDELLGRGRRRAPSSSISQRSALAPVGSRVRRSRHARRAGATPTAESSSLRPGASPSQNGIVGGWPVRVLDAHRAALDAEDLVGVLPSWKMSPARLSTAKSSLTVPTTWFSGSSTTW